MEEIVLKAIQRDVIGKQVKALRRQGRMPAVLYGKALKPVPVSLDMKEANRVLRGVSSSHLVVIDVNGEKHTALVREKQYNPILGKLVHVDFMVISLTEILRASVGLHLEGESPAVRDLNGIIVTGIDQIEVECLPNDLPSRIDVDISTLAEYGASLHVRDLIVSEKVRVLTEPDEMVVIITAPAVEEVVEVPAAVEPEVIERGKKEEEF